MYHCAQTHQRSRVGFSFRSCNITVSILVECTTASLEIARRCLNGIEVDAKCLQKVNENLSSKDKACFCGGIFKFSEMLASVVALLCAENQGRVERLFFPEGIFQNLFGSPQAPTAASTAAPTTAPTTAPNPGGPAEMRTLSLTYTWAQEPSGLTRTAAVSIPATTAGQKVPVVFHLHGKVLRRKY